MYVLESSSCSRKQRTAACAGMTDAVVKTSVILAYAGIQNFGPCLKF